MTSQQYINIYALTFKHLYRATFKLNYSFSVALFDKIIIGGQSTTQSKITGKISQHNIHKSLRILEPKKMQLALII